jgi:hypothetical protein
MALRCRLGRLANLSKVFEFARSRIASSATDFPQPGSQRNKALLQGRPCIVKVAAYKLPRPALPGLGIGCQPGIGKQVCGRGQ